MKKLAWKCLCMVTALIALLFLLCALYRYSGIERRIWIVDGTEAFHPVPDGIDIAVFGTSHAIDGLRSGPQGHTFFNFALSDQSPQYDLAMMRQYQENIKENARVILVVSYTSPYWEETEAHFQRTQGRYYRLLDPENIVDVDLGQYYLSKIFPILGVEPNVFLSKTVLLAAQKTETEFDKDNLEENVKLKLDTYWTKRIELNFPQPVNWETYEEMFSLCEKNNWQVILVTPPYTQYFNESFPAEFYPTFHDTVTRLAEKHAVPYFDYSHEEDFATATQWYSDIDHLNADGAKAFESRFYTDLQEAGLL